MTHAHFIEDYAKLLRGLAEQFTIGGTAFRVLSSCLVSGSHPSLEHGAVGNMKACLDSSCSLHRDFGCRLRVVLPETGLVQKVHTTTRTNWSLSLSPFLSLCSASASLVASFMDTTMVTETLTRTTIARGNALRHWTTYSWLSAHTT